MKTEKDFKNAPQFDKKAIIELMDKLTGKEMVQVVSFIRQQVNNLNKAAVTKSDGYVGEASDCSHPITFRREGNVCGYCGRIVKTTT